MNQNFAIFQSISISEKCKDDSPKTTSSNLMKLKKPKTQTAIASTAVKPTADVLSNVESMPLPLKKVTNNVNILKIEKFHGNVAALKDHLSNQPIPIRSALLTPGGHIRRNDFNKENETENVCDENISSDTLSMSGLLSSSKFQGNSTKTSLDDDYANVTPVASNNSMATENCVTQSTNTEITPTNSPVRNRKRTRSNDRTPSSSTPPMSGTALDVYYNSNHRLIPSPRSNHSTPETPRSNNLAVLFDRHHRLTPSPNGRKDHTSQSINSNPLHHSNGLHSTHSTNFLGPSTSNMRNFDANLRSPKLLAQSNSQFSSVSDLREFAIKSSQSVLSWPSQKLRTSSVKQFTIKNIGGKKLTMKIEVIGPGFQVSDQTTQCETK